MLKTIVMKWVASLKLSLDEKIEDRVLKIISYLFSRKEVLKITLENVDATGILGNKLTKECNLLRRLSISTGDLISLLQEDGQIIEIDIRITCDDNSVFELTVSDGCYLDMLGNVDILPANVLGPYTLGNMNDFRQGK